VSAALPATSEAVDAALLASGTAIWDRFPQRRPNAVPPAYRLPRLYAAEVARHIAGAVADGDLPRAEEFAVHYIQRLPSLLTEQLASTSVTTTACFATPLIPGQQRPLVAAATKLMALLASANVDSTLVLPQAVVNLVQGVSTSVADLHRDACFGGAMPLLVAQSHDVAAMAKEACKPGADGWQGAIRRRLTAALAHEWCHLGRERDALAPPLLDECLSGYLGVLVHRATAYPPGDADTALMGAPRFAQVGQALVGAFGTGPSGIGPLLRAHAGLVPWTQAVGAPFIAAAGQLARRLAKDEGHPLHMLAGGQAPERWRKLIALGAAGAVDLVEPTPEALDALSWDAVPLPAVLAPAHERAVMRDALAAMCLGVRVEDQAFRVRTTPPPTPIVIDRATASVARDLAATEHALMKPHYGWPLRLARTMPARLTVTLRDPTAIEVLVDRLFEGARSFEEPGVSVVAE
jgi:hypothetical protein